MGFLCIQVSLGVRKSHVTMGVNFARKEVQRGLIRSHRQVAIGYADVPDQTVGLFDLLLRIGPDFDRIAGTEDVVRAGLV